MSTSKEKKKKRGVSIQAIGARSTGMFLSLVGVVVPRYAATWLMHLMFSPSRIAPPGRFKEFLQNAKIDREVVDGSEIYHYIWGDSDRSVLLVHGWSGHSGQMMVLAQSLLDAGFKVIAIDFPGHGQSDGKYSSVIHFEKVIADAQRRYGPFHAIVAHSLGAAAATYAISRGLRCQRAVFFGPVASYKNVWSGLQQLLNLSPKLLALSIALAEKWLRISFNDIEPVMLAPALTTELLVIHDRFDRETPISDSEELVRRWPHARLLSTEKLGHTRILADSETVRSTVEFIMA